MNGIAITKHKVTDAKQKRKHTHTHTQMGMAKQKGEINPFLLPEK